MEGLRKKRARENNIYFLPFYFMDINASLGLLLENVFSPKPKIIVDLIHRRPNVYFVEVLNAINFNATNIDYIHYSVFKPCMTLVIDPPHQIQK